MKKLVIVACMFAMASFCACGNQTDSNVSGNDTDTVVVDTINIDSLDSVG